MAIFNAIVALCLFGGAFAQVPSLSACPNVNTAPDFNITRYLGRWYEAQKYFSFSEIGARCIAADYSLNEDGTIKTVNSYKNALGIDKTSQAVARIPDTAEASKLKIRYPRMPIGVEGDYWILGTDYDSYAVVYSCTNKKLTSSKRAWILTKVRNPSEDVIAKAIAVAERNHLDKSLFSKTNQSGCEE